MADKILSIADGLHDELPSITTAKAGRILITTDRGEMYYEPEDKKRIQVNPQADWQQNDETANDYVKNRPGGYEEILENTLSEVAFTGASSILDMTLVVGDTYIVTFDGVEYVSTAKQDDGYPIFIGNTTYAWHSTITDDPFCIYVRAVNSCYINCDSGDHTVKVDKGNIVKIDEKYLDIRNTNIVNGSKTGSLRTIGSAKENSSYTMGDYAFAEGQYTIASGYASHAEGGGGTTASGSRSHAEGIGTKASGYNSHAEGSDTKASGQNSHAEGSNTKASGNNSHAEGDSTTASGKDSHAEGQRTTASGDYSHAEGQSTKAGQMGFKVTACEKLTDTTGTYTLTSVNGLSVNLTYSVYLRTSKENCGKITAIDTTNKKITVNGYPDIALSTGSSSTANYLTIVGKPELGDIKISGDYSHAEGHDTKALGDSSHAEGTGTIASGNDSHAEGFITTALGDYSHAEGSSTNLFSSIVTATNPTDNDIITAWNSNKFSLAKKGGSHVEGSNNLALGGNSHAEGYTTQALGHNSHTEGWSTTASGDRSHAEGSNTIAGQMGFKVTACKKSTDTTGTYTLTSVDGLSVNQHYSVYLSKSKENCGKITAINTDTNTITVDGYPDIALSSSSSSNYLTIVNSPKLGDRKVSGNYSHAEGDSTTALGNSSHTEGESTTASGDSSHAEGAGTTASGYSSHAEGAGTTASGYSSHAEGFTTTASGDYSHTEGESTIASGDRSHAEGYNTKASGNYSHAEGNYTKALGVISHAEGNNTIASGSYSHAEGDSTTALGDYSHAEGNSTVAGQMGFKVTACEKLTDTTGTYTLTSVTGLYTGLSYSVHLSSSKENCGTITDINTENKKITVDGYPDIRLSPSSSSTANYLTIVGNPKLGDIKVSGDYSHAEGNSTIALDNYQHVQGKFNIEDSNNIYADIIGNGDVDLGTRSNAATVDWQGNAWYAGDVYVGSTSGKNKDEGSKKLATENRTDNTFANALKGSKSGSVILIDDVSPVTHEMGVKISSVQKNLLNRLIAKAYNSSDMEVPTEDFINTYCSKKISFKQGTTYTFSVKSVSGFSSDVAWQPSFYIFDNGSLFVSNATTPPVTFSTDFFTSDSNANEYTCYKNKALWTKNNMIQNSEPWTMTITPVKDFEAVFIVTSGNVTDSVIVTEAQIEVGSTATSYVPYVENPIIDLTTVKVRKHGKNLFDKNNVNKLAAYINGNTITSGGQMSTVWIPCSPLTTYTVSKIKSSRFAVGFTSEVPNIGITVNNRITNNASTQITHTSSNTDKYIVIWLYHSGYDNDNGITESEILDSLQIEIGTTATDYEPYVSAEYAPNADGTVDGVTSLYPNTTLMTDTDGVLIDCEYNRDINKAFAELQQAIISLGGNV